MARERINATITHVSYVDKAAHGFMKDAPNIDKQYDFNDGVGEVVKSYIVPADFTLGEQTICCISSSACSSR